MIENLFRFEDRVYSTVEIDPGGGERYGVTPVRLELYTFKVISETPCGYWIDYAFTRKWVSKTSRRRFAYPSHEEALFSFVKRKEKQASIAQTKVNRANHAIELARRWKHA